MIQSKEINQASVRLLDTPLDLSQMSGDAIAHWQVWYY